MASPTIIAIINLHKNIALHLLFYTLKVNNGQRDIAAQKEILFGR